VKRVALSSVRHARVFAVWWRRVIRNCRLAQRQNKEKREKRDRTSTISVVFLLIRANELTWQQPRAGPGAAPTVWSFHHARLPHVLSPPNGHTENHEEGHKNSGVGKGGGAFHQRLPTAMDEKKAEKNVHEFEAVQLPPARTTSGALRMRRAQKMQNRSDCQSAYEKFQNVPKSPPPRDAVVGRLA